MEEVTAILLAPIVIAMILFLVTDAFFSVTKMILRALWKQVK